MRAGRFTAVTAVAPAAVGLAVLMTWITGIRVAWLQPGPISMKVNTALAFVLAGIALWVRRRPGRRSRLAIGCAAGVVVIAAASVSEHVVGWDLHIDQLVTPDPAHHRAPGRMAIETAICLAGLGLALLTIDVETRRGRRPAQVLALIAGTLALVVEVAYLYGAEPLYRYSAFASMAVLSGVLIIVLVLGILFARPDRGLMAAVTHPTAASARVARTVLPLAVALPIALGALLLWAQRQGLFGLEVGLALFALSNVVIISALVWHAAVRALRVDEVTRGMVNASRDGELAQQGDQRFLFELADDLRGLRSESAVLAEVATRVGRYLGVSRCQLAEVDLVAATMNVRESFIDGAGVPDLRGVIPLANGHAETITALRAGEIVVNRDASIDERTRATYPTCYGPMVGRAYAVIPVMVAGSLVAMFLASVATLRNWQAREITVLQAAADRAWGRIVELRLERQQEALLAELLDLTRTLEVRVEERTVDLGTALAQREVLLQEVHHRVKNNLQVISSLIHMQTRSFADGPGRDALRDCQRRVQAIALIHEKLYQGRDYGGVPFSDYARDLVDNVARLLGPAAAAVRVEVDIGPLHLPIDRATPCGLIINELIVNSFKHGFPDGRAGTVRVAMTMLDEDTAELIVSDDGQGAAAGTDLLATGSLGMRLVSALTRQLRGELAITTPPGYMVRLRFPIHDDSEVRS